MTIITKPLSDKKVDNLEPLVEDVKVDVRPERSGVRLGVPVKPTIVVRSHKVSSATTAFLFFVALAIMGCGIVTGIYLYGQFARAQTHRYVCSIPYDFQKLQSSRLLQSDIEMLQGDVNLYKDFFHEEFEIEDSYEKISVPDFSGGRKSKFVHDFRINKTGIVDVDAHRCFVMPLNYSVVLPPRNMSDLTRKMMEGYYNVDTATLHDTMRVVLPAIEDRSSVGPYIQKECEGSQIYKLERVVTGVYKRKRSAEPSVKFAEFGGKSTLVLELINYAELEEPQTYPVAMA